MRRISLAVALIGAVAAGGCGGNKKPASDTGAKGTAGVDFTLTLNNQGPGTVSDGARTCASNVTCSWTYASGTTVVLTATATGTNYFNGFFGACGGTGTCSLSGNADQYVVSYFSATPQAHPNWAAGHPSNSPLNCASCHGTAGQGQGLAPSCASCHNAAPSNPGKSGLKVANVSVTSLSPAVVKFQLLDDAGLPVDVFGVGGAGMSGKNQPMTLRVYVGQFAVDTNGSAGQLRSPNGVEYMGQNALARTASATTSGVKGTGFYQGGNVCTGAAGAESCTCTGANPCVSATMNAGALSYDAATKTYTASTSAGPTPASNVARFTASTSNTHVAYVLAARQENLTNAMDAKKYTAANERLYIKSDLSPATDTRAIVSDDKCNACHNGFKSDGSKAIGFHPFEGRVSGEFCAVCHYETRGNYAAGTTTPDGLLTGNAASGSFIHRIHGSEQIAGLNLFDGIAVGYPQAISNCGACHPDTTRGNQYKTHGTLATCGSCHPAGPKAGDTGHGAPYYNADGTYNPTSSGAGITVAVATNCTGCHAPYMDSGHVPVVAPDATNCLVTGDLLDSANCRKNAAWMAGAAKVPFGASQLAFTIDEVTVDVTSLNPSIKFTVTKDGAPVTFNTFDATETTGKLQLMDNFVGTIGVYVGMALPQDGITDPIDWNASGSSNLRALWNGGVLYASKAGTGYTQGATTCSGKYDTATNVDARSCTCSTTNLCVPTTSPGSLTATGTAGQYIATLAQVKVPASAKMVTGALGNAYSIPNVLALAQGNFGTMPFTQTNVPAVHGGPSPYPYDSATGTGGLIVPIQTVSKTATGYTARRSITSTAKCNDCHARMGVEPTFHLGQRNQAESCEMCHHKDLQNKGWAVSTKDFVHAIHAGTKANAVGFRNAKFTWEIADTAPATELGFSKTEWPGQLTACSQCHVGNSYNYNAAATIPSNLFWSTSAAGKVAAAVPGMSPYITVGTDYGATAAFTATSGAFTVPALTTLVISPVTATCFACHDGTAAQDHMKGNGGQLYVARSAAGGTTLHNNETCLNCHGEGQLYAISRVHK